MRSFTFILAAALALGASSLPAFAEGYGYLGVSKLGGAGVNNGGAVALAAGYRFGPYAAAEVGYFDPGELERSSTASGSATTLVKHELSGASFAALGILPLGRLEAFGTAGAYYLRGKYESRTFGPGIVPDAVVAGSGSGFAPAVGVGLLYRFADLAAVRASWERISMPSGVFGDGHDLGNLDRASVALQFFLQ